MLLPPEDPEEDLPPRHWPEPPRTRWGGLALVALVGVAGLFAWVRLSSEAIEPPPPMPAYAEGMGSLGADAALAEQQELALAPPPQSPAAVDPQPEESAPATDARDSEVETAAPRPEPESVPVQTPPAAPPRELARAAGSLPDEGRAVPSATGTPAQNQAIPPVDRGAVANSTREATTGLPAVAGGSAAPPAERPANPPPRQPERTAERAPAPTVDLTAAQAALRQGADRFAGEVDRGATTGLRRMILAADGAAGDLVAFVDARKPDASVQSLGPVTVEGDLARAEARIGYAWRAEFGVTKRGTSSVQVLARLVDGTWTVAGVQPMTGPPR